MRTEADELLDEIKEDIKNAREKLAKVVYGNTEGADYEALEQKARDALACVDKAHTLLK